MFWSSVVVAAASAANFIGLGAAEFATDEAKDALNIPYPHPPLVRGAMVLSQEIFGYSEAAARLPVALSGVAAAVLMFLLLRKFLREEILAAFAAIAYALLPLQLEWSRSAYLSVPLAAAWLLALYGMARAEENGRDIAAHWMIFAGLALSLWTELQAALFIPVWAWWYWSRRKEAAASREIFSLAALGLFMIALAGLYVLSSPQIVGDILVFSEKTGRGALSGGLMAWSWGAWAAVAAAVFLKKEARGGAYAPLLVLYLAVAVFLAGHPGHYYMPYLFVPAMPFAALLLRSLPGFFKLAASSAAAALLLFSFPKTLFVPQHRLLFTDYAKEFSALAEGEAAAGIVGPHGYEVYYSLPAPARPLPAEMIPAEGVRRYFLFDHWRETPEERAALSKLRLVTRLDQVEVYEADAAEPGTQPFSK